jgi:hypothetical protein
MGQLAVLCIIAGEVKHHGVCDLPIDKIAALAGVCRTTVQTTLHEARRHNHIKITERPQPGRKSLPNVVEVVSAEWRMWLKRGPTAHRPIGSKTVNLVSTTKNKNTDDTGGVSAQRCRPGALATRLATDIKKDTGRSGVQAVAGWSDGIVSVTVQQWIDDLATVGIGPDVVLPIVKAVLKRKPDPASPNSIAFLSPAILRLVADTKRRLTSIGRGSSPP